MTKALPEDNPCRKAYIDYNVRRRRRTVLIVFFFVVVFYHRDGLTPFLAAAQGPNNNRSSWDPMTTMYAVRGNQGDWSVPTYGENHVVRVISGAECWAALGSVLGCAGLCWAALGSAA